jgi:uncharacterized protein YkwD
MVSRRSLLYSLGGIGLAGSVYAGLQSPDYSTNVDSETDTETDAASETDAETASEPEWKPKAAEKAVHRHTNQKRTATGHEPLAWRDDVADAARAYAQKIADAGQLTHTLNGIEPAQRYQRHGIEAYNGENAHRIWWDTEMSMDSGTEKITTAGGFGSLVVQDWFDSSGHRDNILRDNSVAEGIGVERKRRTVYVVQVFTR